MPTITKRYSSRNRKTHRKTSKKYQIGGVRMPRFFFPNPRTPRTPRTIKAKNISLPTHGSFVHINKKHTIPAYTSTPIIRAKFQEERDMEIGKKIKGIFDGKKNKSKNKITTLNNLIKKYTRASNLTNSNIPSTRQLPEIYSRASPDELISVFGPSYKNTLKNFKEQYTEKGLNTTLEGQTKFVGLRKAYEVNKNSNA